MCFVHVRIKKKFVYKWKCYVVNCLCDITLKSPITKKFQDVTKCKIFKNLQNKPRKSSIKSWKVWKKKNEND